MVALDAWQEHGSARSRRVISPGLRPRAACVATIAENGDLLVRRIVTNASTATSSALAAARAGPALVARPRDRRAAAVRLLRTIRSTHRTRSCSSAPPTRANGRCRAPSCSADADPECARGQITRGFRGRVSRRSLVRLVDTGADRERDGRGSPRAGRHAGKAAARAPRRAGLRCSTRGGGRRGRVRGLALRSIPRDTLIAVRRTFEDGAIREAFRTLQSAPARASPCARSRSWRSRAKKSRAKRYILPRWGRRNEVIELQSMEPATLRLLAGSS